jgi:hypothetical protein
MIYIIPQSEWDLIQAELQANEAFGYEDNGKYLFNTSDIALYQYDVDARLQSAVGMGYVDFIKTLSIYSDGIESINVQQLNYTDDFGHPIIATEKPSGNFNTIISHNLCDNTTWGGSSSSWELVPAEGKILFADKAEVQFEHDVSISPNTMYLEYYAWVGGGANMIVQQFEFNNIRDIFELGNDHYHAPAMPELSTGLSTIVFNYASKLKFYGTDTPGQLYKLVIRTDGDNEITGSYASVALVVSEIDQ